MEHKDQRALPEDEKTLSDELLEKVIGGGGGHDLGGDDDAPNGPGDDDGPN